MASQEVGHSTWFRSCIPIISAKMNPVAHAQASARVLKHGVVKYSSLVVGLKITAVVTVVLSLGVTLLVYERCVHTPVG